MGIFKRLGDLSAARINKMIDAAEQKDPEAFLNQCLRNAKDDLLDATNALADQIALSIKFKKLFESEQATVERAEQNAITFAKAGNVDLVQKAVEAKKTAEAQLNQYKAQWEQYEANAQQFQVQVEEMKRQIAEMEAKKASIVARIEAARAQENIGKTMSSLSNHSLAANLDKFESLAADAEAKAQATSQVYRQDKTLDEKAAELSKSSEVDAEVARLMAEYGSKKA